MHALWDNSRKHCASSSAFNIGVLPFSSKTCLLGNEIFNQISSPCGWTNETEGRKVILKLAATNPTWDRQQRRNRSCLCPKAMHFRRWENYQHNYYKEGSLAQNCTVEPVISSLPCLQGLLQLLPHRCCGAHLLSSTLGLLWDWHLQLAACTFTTITHTKENWSKVVRKEVWHVRREEWLPRSAYLKVKPNPAKNNLQQCPAGGNGGQLLKEHLSQRSKHSVLLLIKTHLLLL